MSRRQLPEQRWQAVVRRDKQADGAFVYAVRTTGVYCRPSCPSRTAKRENVEFFDAGELALAAGYRACKRCRPETLSLEQRRQALAVQACRTIEQSASALPLAELARQAGLSPHHFHRIFKTATGLTPKAFYKSVRAKRVAESLQASPSVTEAIFAAGFNSAGRFYEEAGALLGMSPSAYRKGAAGERIRYAVAPCALGQVLVAATHQGVCAIEFDAAAPVLVERLRERFPRASFEPADDEFRRWVSRVLEYLAQPHGALDLPLDVRGTVFQHRVWQALREIPAGQTASYAEIARRIGQPKAHRAVAHACAKNQVAVAIPCHRVVRGDGDLAGYRWGVERKAALLRREDES
ncbi:MAG: bifunctional DNA-binding transcriptional regulator/O6-methylguanine-DNA methyltransferase Ada [Gallionellaceae bacterium]|nr:bifunctional DNA-binding transcriptional regulator/O6-methylguanine-DNA methyltransferase Ada [Gallionellaceae bacterium]